MVETDGTSQLAEDLLKFKQQLERHSEQYPAEYKIRFYMEHAQQQLEIAQDEKKREDMRLMILEGKIALDAVKAKDVDRLLEHYEAIHRYKLKYNMRAYHAQGVSLWRAEIAAKNRRVQLPKRAVMCAMDDGYKTACEVENFLLNESSLTDGWALSILRPYKARSF